MRLQFCQAWSRLACMAILAAIALVACGGGPGGSDTPTVALKPIAPMTIKVGDTLEIKLGETFSGRELTYTATSDKPAIVTVMPPDNAKKALTIEGKGVGKATITVVATDSQKRNSPPHSFTVTVDPLQDDDEEEEEEEEEQADDEDDEDSQSPTITSPSDCPSPLPSKVGGEYRITLTIKRNEIGECRLPSKATLREPQAPAEDAKGVTVSPSADADKSDVWIIRAHKKGRYEISIMSGDASPERLGKIDVVVPNSRPVRDTTEDPLATTIAIAGTPDSNAPYSAGLSDALDTYFDDADEDSFRYSIGKKPGWLLIDAQDGFVETGTSADTLTFEVLEKVTENFQVTIYANDESDRSQQPVVLTFEADESTKARTPRKRTYEVTQTETGKWTDIPKVGGPRLGVEHTLIFHNGGDRSGFQFPRSKVKDLLDAKRLFEEAVSEITQTAELYYVRGGKYFGADEEGASAAPYSAWKKTVAEVTGTRVNTDLYILRSAGVVEARWSDSPNLGVVPAVIFELTKEGTGSITIEYHIWAGSPDGDTAPGQTDAGNKREPVISAKLTLNIMACSSPPDPLGDCK